MNRILKKDNRFFVLITPHNKFDLDSSLMLGNWTDDRLSGYFVKQYDNFDSAFRESQKYPDIDWLKLILFHKDIYIQLCNMIKDDLDTHRFIVNFDPHLMSPDEFKEAMFIRVIKMGERFRLAYNMNDIITINISNPWISNLKEMRDQLLKNRDLRINKVVEEQYVIHLIGKTTIGTTYSISLWTDLLYQWARWIDMHPKIQDAQKEITLKNTIKAQDEVEKSISLR